MSDIAYPSRISAKFFLRSADVDAAGLIPVFHRWIRQGSSLDGLVIDVADYHHVPDGPGVMLIGHEWDRSVDFSGGRPGVLSVTKRGLEGDLVSRVRAVVADALHVATLLQDEESVGNPAVGVDEVEITVLDRLFAPNTPETLTAIGGDIASALAPLNGGEAPALSQVGDERRPFRVTATLSASGDAAAAADLVGAASAA